MGLVAAIREAFARREDPYAGGDIALARRLDGLLTITGTVVALMLIPLAPPTHAIGNAGWFVAGAVALVGGASTIYDRVKPGGRTWVAMLAWNYVGVAQITVVQWLAGPYAPYRDLFMLSTVFVGGIHPPRRLIPFLGIVNAITIAPLFFTPWDATLTGEVVALVLLWSSLSFMASIANMNARLHRIGSVEAEALARADSLTGLGNRRAFDEALIAEIARSRRVGSSLSLMLADLNDFKEINDAHGHLAGDDCLRDVAAVLRDEVRLHDHCFRWGGDEFAAILTESDGSTAAAVAERLTAAVAERCRQPDGAPLTIGAAYAELTETMTADDLLARADSALMALKSGSVPSS
jgi:diguanylate cyclase (GGDEF)-like protein